MNAIFVVLKLFFFHSIREILYDLQKVLIIQFVLIKYLSDMIRHFIKKIRKFLILFLYCIAHKWDSIKTFADSIKKIINFGHIKEFVKSIKSF